LARDRLTFRQRDVTAAIKAVKAAGGKVAKVEIRRDGGMTLVLTDRPGNDLDADTEIDEVLHDSQVFKKD
jgi:hypothetical protein